MPYGTVVLSTKGLASKYLMDALAEYDRQLNPLRLELAPHISAPFFWHAVGTFGEKPQYETMGSGNQTSTGTIIQAGSISKLDKETLRALFVGVDVMNMMRDFQEQAKEWYDAWKETDNIRVVDEVVVTEDIPF